MESVMGEAYAVRVLTYLPKSILHALLTQTQRMRRGGLGISITFIAMRVKVVGSYACNMFICQFCEEGHLASRRVM